MDTFFLLYSLCGVVWAFYVDIMKGKGFMAQMGYIMFFPFAATTFTLECLKEKSRPKS